MPYDFSARTTTCSERKRVHQNRFARARFTCEHGQSGCEFEFDSIDDGEIANLDMSQHLSYSVEGMGITRSPRPQRNLERRMR